MLLFVFSFVFSFFFGFDSLGLVVLKLDVQAVLDADLHADAVVDVGVAGQRVHGNVLLLHNVRQPPDNGHSHKVPQAHVDARVPFREKERKKRKKKKEEKG